MRNKDLIVYLYFNEHMKPVDIAKKIGVSRSAVTQVLQKDEKYKISKEVRKENNQKNRKCKKAQQKSQIRKKMSERREFDDLVLRKMHDQASMELSAPRKLSDMGYRNWNKSAFKYNTEKRRFEFDENLGRSYDVPKYIKVNLN